MMSRRFAELGALAVAGLLAGLLGCAEDSGVPVQQDTGGAPSAQATESAGDHVSFFVIGKSWHFDQNTGGELSLIDMGYFAEIFKTVGGDVTSASMHLDAPGAEPMPFDEEGDGGAVLYGMSRKRHSELEALDAELPNGDYVFDISTPGGDIENFAVTLSGPDGVTDLPPGPVIGLAQNGQPVASDAIEPGADVLVSWTPFDTGRADPNGIADDLIFVMMADCHGERAFHSGRPLATPNPLEPDRPSGTLLAYADTEVTIPGDAWIPGMRYTLDVEHARLLDTDRRDGVVGMSTFAVTTHLAVETLGDTDPTCPADEVSENTE